MGGGPGRGPEGEGRGRAPKGEAPTRNMRPQRARPRRVGPVLSLGGLLVEFWWCFEDPQMCTFGLSGCRVKPRRLGVLGRFFGGAAVLGRAGPGESGVLGFCGEGSA